MKIDVLTLFPDMFHGVFTTSMLGKAADKGLVSFQTINFRDYAGNKHQTVDDTPYGGGVGMVLKPEPIFRAVREHRGQANPRVILMCPQGRKYDQQLAEELAQESHLMLICGHYEGFDERIREHLVTDEISIGDYVLTGGEIAAMAIVDSVVRLLPGVLGNEQSSVDDSFSTGRLEYPQYTRPAVFEDHEVPDVLLSGHHANIERWRKKMSLWKTLTQRPDLLERVRPDREEEKWLKEWRDSGHFK